MQDAHNVDVTEGMNTKRRSPLAVGLAMLLAAAAFFSGLHIGNVSTAANNQTAGLFSLFASAPQPDTEADLTEFWRVWELLEQKYASPSTTIDVSVEERIQGAIDGLVDSYGDPYTVYLPPVEAEEFEEDISGNFSGVGMEVGLRDGLVTVIAPLPDTPAEGAGILAGDVVVRIDGESTEDMTIDDAVIRIRGEKGTEVVLSVFREGGTEILEIPIIRDTIDIPTINTELRDGVFIIQLYSFNALSEMKMQEALREFVESGAENMVFDLRGNPGGFLQSAVAISSFFLPTGKVVVRENFGDGRDEEVYRSQGRTLRQFAPRQMVVLVDGGSASASEIVAGALKEHDVATVIGETTFGKGSVQELVDLPDGSSLKVTIARWLTPDGTSISDGGLEPNIEVVRTVQQRLNNEDPQLNAAVEYLNGTFDPVNYSATSTELFDESAE
ncbi:MAG: S41 family peptidase [Patescibacteria group bacterium]